MRVPSSRPASRLRTSVASAFRNWHPGGVVRPAGLVMKGRSSDGGTVSDIPSMVITIDEDDDVMVFRNLGDAEAWIEGIDVSEGVYVDVFLDDGRIVNLSGGPEEEVVATVTGECDLDRLRARLCALEGPRHLADYPRAYASEWLWLNEWESRRPFWRSRSAHLEQDHRPRPERPDWQSAQG